MSNKPRSAKQAKWIYLGIADHAGVSNVGGRIGAALGPAALERALLRMTGALAGSQSDKTKDVLETRVTPTHELTLCSDVAENHRKAISWIEKEHRCTGLSIVVGGGHDHGYSHLHGILSALKDRFKKPRLGCINIDAHLDLRVAHPKITSGSPFYLAIEGRILEPKRLVEFGIQSHCNAPELWDYAKKHKIPVIGFDMLRGGRAVPAFARALRKLSSQCDAVVISLDLDAVAEAYAPGVSAPQSEGFTPSEIIEMMEIAGACKKVASLGVFELNPVHDMGDRTARLGATAVYHFLARALHR